MVQDEPMRKPRIRAAVDAVRKETDALSKLLLLATIIVLIAYSSKIILDLPQAKEYLASAFERLFDKQDHEGDIRWQVILAIGTMLLQMLICAALSANFNKRVMKVVDNTGSKAWYLATAAIILAFAWPYYSFINSINGAYTSVINDFTGADGASAGTVNIGQATKEVLDPAWRYYIGSVLVCGSLALFAFFAHLRWPVAMSRFSIGLCMLALILGGALHIVASYGEPDLFRWVGAYALVFAGGAFIWTVVLLISKQGISASGQLVLLSVIGTLMIVKAWDLDPTAYIPHKVGKLVQTTPCTKEAAQFARFEETVFKRLELYKELKLGDIESCKDDGGQPALPRQSQLTYYEQKTQTRSISASLKRRNKKRQASTRSPFPRAPEPTIGQLYENNSNKFFNVPSINEKIDAWLSLRLDDIRRSSNGEPYRIFVASAQGGGLYAAYHAALALARLQDGCPDFGRQLFAVSAVSGGAVGARLFSDLIYRGISAKNAAPATGDTCKEQDGDGPYQKAVRLFFLTDYQAPLIGKLLYTDVPYLLLPRWLTITNRASALDGAFESGMDRFWSRLDQFNLSVRKDRPVPRTHNRFFFSDPAMRSNEAPATIVNASLANNGMPVVLAPFYFSNFYDAPKGADTPKRTDQWAYFRFGHFFDLSPGIDMPMMTGVLLGARFPYVVPGGRLPIKLPSRKRLYKAKEIALADGGYFDNTGTATALALILRIKKRLQQHKDGKLEPGVKRIDVGNGTIKIELVRMVDTIRPGYIKMDASPHEVVLPLATVYQTRLFSRDFYGRLMKGGIDVVYDVDFDPDDIGVSLSWQLSRSARQRIEKTIKVSIARPVNDEPTEPEPSGGETPSETTQLESRPTAGPAPILRKFKPRALIRSLQKRR